MRAAFISLVVILFLGRSQAEIDWISSPADACKSLQKYKKVLVTAAHPDDIETIAGGTVALLARCGAAISYVITTNGDKGWNKDTSMTSEQLALIREEEQLTAAQVLHVNNVTFLRQEDSMLEGVDPVRLKHNVTRAIRVTQPDLVLSFHPEIDYATYRFGLMHADHKHTAIATMDSLWPTARDYLCFPDLLEEGVLPWITPEAWLFAFSQPVNTAQNDYVVVDITGELFNMKYQALLQHKSQYSDVHEVRRGLMNIGKFVSNSFSADYNQAEAFLSVKF